MNILFVASHHKLYGANRSMLSVIKHLRNQGHSISVLVPFKGDLSEELLKENLKCHIFPFYPSFLYYKPCSIHILSPLFGAVTFMLLPIILLKIKNKYDLIYSNSSAECLGYYIARLMKIKHIVHVREFLSLDYNLFYWRGKSKKRRHLQKSDGVIFVSKIVADHVMQAKTLRENERVIYNGIKIDSPLLDKHVTEKAVLNIGMIGVICDGKGQENAITYFSQIAKNNLHLHIYGTGNDSFVLTIENLIKTLGLSQKVTLHGYISDPEIIYSNIDILLMFSKAEGFGRVTIEAMAAGVPVIGFDSGGTAELIENGKTGYLFKDFTSFEGSINHLLSYEKYDRIRKDAYISVVKNFSEEIYCTKITCFIEHILNKKQ